MHEPIDRTGLTFKERRDAQDEATRAYLADGCEAEILALRTAFEALGAKWVAKVEAAYAEDNAHFPGYVSGTALEMMRQLEGVGFNPIQDAARARVRAHPRFQG